MRYRDFIETYFAIDEPNTGKLVPFKFNKVQRREYDLLCEEHDIETNGISAPIRDLILKARREGFTSLILALFAADMVLNPDPTIAQEISYKDDATRQHFKRYKTFLTSYFQQKGVKDMSEVFKTDNKNEIELRAYDKDGKEVQGPIFKVGTASAKTGERGGTLQKLLFTEAAFYPNTEIMTAKEILNATIRQVDIRSGWIFVESTGKRGTEYESMWRQSSLGQSRFRPRFFGWKEFYSEDEYKLISSEFTDQNLLKQEYPATPEEAFASSASAFTTVDKIKLLTALEAPSKRIIAWMELKKRNYIEQAEFIKDFLVSMEKKYFQRNLFVGIDVAKDPDSTVITVMEERGIGEGRVQCVTIDSTGAGDYLPDWLERNSRWYIHRVKITAQQNDAMYKNLEQVIENKLTGLPPLGEDQESKTFLEQIASLEMERKGDLIVVAAPGDNHDDYADSWALAEYGYSSLRGFPKSKQEREDVRKTGIAHLLGSGVEEREGGSSDNYT